MKKTVNFIIAFFTLASFSNAQEWSRMMQDPNANFYDIVKEFDNYWKDRPYERGKGYKAFKRWQWFAEPRVYPSGDMRLASRGFALEQYQQFLNENPNSKFPENAVISATTANWTPLGPFGSPTGGDAGRVQTIRMHPAGTNTFYVGTAAGGFWMTNNGGSSYTTTTDQLGSCGVSDIAISSASPNIIYISTGDKDAGDTHSIGILKSTDGGQSWNTTGLTWQTSQQVRVYRLLINPQNANSLIAATSVGMYKSVNAGLTWSVTAAGNYVDAEYRPADTTVVHAVSNNGYFKSTNGGMNYTGIQVANPLSSNRLSLAVTAANNNYVYILVSKPNNGFGGLYRSTNAGASYNLMSTTPNVFDWSTNGSGAGGQGWYDIAIDASPTNANEIIVGGVNTWRSTNGGTSWTLHTHWYGGGGKPYVHADLHHVLYASGTTIFLGTDGGVARTTNSGSNWTTINGNMNIAQIYKMGLSSSTAGRIITGHQDNGTNLSNGLSWSEVYGGDGMDCFIDWSNNLVMVASYVNGDFNVTTNGGGSWTNITSGLVGTGAWVAPIVQSPSSSNTYYCGYQNVYKSTNQGISWTQKGTIGSTLDEIKIAPSNTNIIYATHSGAVYRTTNDGTNWTNVTGSIPTASASITDLAINNINPDNIFVTLSGYSSGNKVFKSINGGVTWTNYSTGLPNIPVNCIVYTNNSAQAIYVGTDLGVYYREASMSAWILYNSGLPNIVVNDMEIFYPTGKLRAATYARGVWETNLYSNPGVAPVAAFSAMSSSACINTPIQFNDLSGNIPTSWNWTFPGGSPATSTLQNPSVTYTATGVYTVSFISANGNGTSTPYTSTISSINAPTVSTVPKTICSGDVTNLQVLTNGNVVNWNTGNQGFFLFVTNTVTTVFSFTSSLGACQTPGSYTLFVDPMPDLPTVINMGTYITTTVSAISYQWYLNGVAIVGETTATHTPAGEGLYSVWVANGLCELMSDQVQFSPIGIKELTALQKVSIGPNPVREQLFVSFKDEMNSEIKCEIQNNLGQIVNKLTIKTDNKQAKINVQNLPAGIYYLKLKSGDSQNSYKFIKQ